MTSSLTTDGLKRQARRMRDHFAEKNIDLSHAAALEALAKQHGYRNWNILAAALLRLERDVPWPGVADRVSGSYLGHPFTGQILKVQALPHDDRRRYTILFDEPIDVVTSKYFSNHRQRVSCILDDSLRSTNHKGLPDNVLRLAP